MVANDKRTPRNLSFKDFLGSLRKFHGSWRIADNCIRSRMNEKEYTPLSAVAWLKCDRYFTLYQIPQAIEAIPISDDLGQLIVCAEDGIRGYNQKLNRALPIFAARKAILEAIGLVNS